MGSKKQGVTNIWPTIIQNQGKDKIFKRSAPSSNIKKENLRKKKINKRKVYRNNLNQKQETRCQKIQGMKKMEKKISPLCIAFPILLFHILRHANLLLLLHLPLKLFDLDIFNFTLKFLKLIIYQIKQVMSLNPQKTEKKPMKNQSLPTLNLDKFKLIPKHLSIPKKKVFSTKNFIIQQTTQQKIQRQRKSFIKPLKDVQQIMKKFDQTLNEKSSITHTPRKNKKQKIFQTELENRIETLLSLPTVKKIKAKAQNIRMKTVNDLGENTIKLIITEAKRLQILSKYQKYVQESTSSINLKNRAKTLADHEQF